MTGQDDTMKASRSLPTWRQFKEIEDLKVLLRRVEHADSSAAPGARHCFFCRAPQHNGHAPDCELDKALGRGRGGV